MIMNRWWTAGLNLSLLLVCSHPYPAAFARAFPPDLAALDEVRLTFKAIVFATPCRSDLGQKPSFTLPFARLSHMQTAGSKSTAKTFTLSFSDCPAGMQRVKIAIQGEAHQDDPKVFANVLNGKNAAQNIGIRLWSGDDAAKEEARWFDGAIRTFKIDVTTRSAFVDLTADMFTPQGEATAGEVQALVKVTMTYE